MTRQKILVADDDALILTTISNGLTKAGYHVFSAANGQEAVTIGLAKKPDLAVLDIRMPVMSGMDAANQLRSKAGIPSIFLSAYTDSEVVEQATREGALGYLVKPIDTHQLIPAIKAALQRNADMQQLHVNQANLTAAIHNSREISKAIGVYMERFQVEEDKAFQTLRDYARASQQKLVVLARQLTQTSENKNDLINRVHQSTRI